MKRRVPRLGDRLAVFVELGVQAVGCGVAEGLHVCEDEVVLERVDDNGVPVGPDEPATRTLATGLANRTFPFIRYDLGDEVTFLPGPCGCGSAFARVADIGGRRDDDFRYGPTTVPASAFRHVLGTDPRISEYQVAQTVTGADILAVGRPDVNALRAALVAALRRYGLPGPTVEVRVVDRIPRHQATGKLKRFIALPPPVGRADPVPPLAPRGAGFDPNLIKPCVTRFGERLHEI